MERAAGCLSSHTVEILTFPLKNSQNNVLDDSTAPNLDRVKTFVVLKETSPAPVQFSSVFYVFVLFSFLSGLT